ncbi:MAG: amino acid adenylation domain-containing protein, partial [Bacteroidota bacterium]
QYATDLFKPETIERFADYFSRLTESIVQDPEQKAGSINFMSPEEEHQLLVSFNETDETIGDNTVLSMFQEQVKRTPDHTAITLYNQEITYQQLDQQSDKLAAYLLAEGLEKGNVVALMAERSIETLTGILGILKAGGAYLPIDPAQPAPRIEFMLADSGAELLLHAGIDQKPSNYPVKTVNLTVSLRSDMEANRRVDVGSSDMAYIIYTSGSTGNPKGVMVAHRSIANLIQSQRKTFGIDDQERILQFSTLAFDASVEQIWLALTTGATLVLVDKETMADYTAFDHYIADQKVTHLHATPSFLEHVIFETPNRVKRVVAGGEECKVTLAKKFVKDYDFFNEYGPTETTVTSTISQVSSESATSGNNISIGRPIGNTKLYILDKNRSLAPLGSIGELYIGGDGLALGYLNNEKLTRERFEVSPFDQNDRIYKSGDLARWLPDGTVEYLGRLDHQVKVRGFRIELG